MPFAKDQLLPGETLIVQVHQHFLVLLRPILLNIVIAVVLVGLVSAIPQHPYWLLLFYIAPLAYLLWEVYVRSQREYVVTDRRVVKQEGVFAVHSFDASLDKVNNVFHEQTLLGRLFNYGLVGLETASEQGTTVFDYIPDPVRFKNSIVAQRERRTAGGPVSQPRSREDIPRLLEQLADLRDRKILSPEEFEAKKKALLDQL